MKLLKQYLSNAIKQNNRQWEKHSPSQSGKRYLSSLRGRDSWLLSKSGFIFLGSFRHGGRGTSPSAGFVSTSDARWRRDVAAALERHVRRRRRHLQRRQRRKTWAFHFRKKSEVIYSKTTQENVGHFQATKSVSVSQNSHMWKDIRSFLSQLRLVHHRDGVPSRQGQTQCRR